MTRAACVPLALLVAALAAGCESTQSKSARLEANADTTLDEGKGVDVKKQNPDVKVLSTSTLKDKYGEAVVVRLRNVGKEALANLPISVKLADKSGKSVYRNTQPGLETALAHIAFLKPGQELFWVNDQVVSTGRPAQADTKVGAADPVSGDTPQIEIRGTHLERDPVSGIAAKGRVINHSQLLQRRLPIFCVARRGGAVVAAGRAILEKVKPGKSAHFTVFFIGDPKGAELTLTPLPTKLKGSPS
jgi:hypothetical protein